MGMARRSRRAKARRPGRVMHLVCTRNGRRVRRKR